eukprot:GHVL01025211.1.p1 GENE.GHVL01025211.1~~GHVL01025211.1.p1  ORF type:complete len:417 (+),score=75.74 GHVL01025211.1:28-1278(+)
MKFAKQVSKRQKLHRKYNVEKKVKEHHRRVKKMARKSNDIPKKKKLVKIPNTWPMKAEMLAKIQQERLELREKKPKMDIEEMANVAAAAAAAHNALPPPETVAERVSKSYYQTLRKVIAMSDVIIEVLDARDPQGCRSAKIEKEIVGEGKKLILLLNKVDLVPKEVVNLWVNHLKKEYPTMEFKAASNSAHRTIHASSSLDAASPGLLKSGAHVLGAEDLIQLIKNYSRSSSGGKLSLTVGIIGYPNVGKSSVVNSLKRKAGVVKVGGEAGVTKTLQEVNLDSKIKLVDSPGVLFEGSQGDVNCVLRNTIKLSTVQNPVWIVEELIKRISKLDLIKHFKMSMFKEPQEFLGIIARSRGLLKKGGRPNFDSAARVVIQEWTSGKLRYHTLPPSEMPNAQHETCEIVINNNAMPFELN